MEQKSSEYKRVFFLGAGSTKDAGVPLQCELLPGYLRDVRTEYKDDVVEYLSDAYSFQYERPRSLSKPDDSNVYPILEDVFSSMDYAIMNKEFFRGYRPSKLEHIRSELVFGIVKLIDQRVENTDYVDRFARALTDWRLNSDAEDPYSIITTNWDIVLLNRLREYHDSIIEAYMEPKDISNLEELNEGDRSELILVDYCLYAHHLTDEKNHIPSLKIKSMGYKNIKYLFLHGCPTLLYCRKCKRIFSPPAHNKMRDYSKYVTREFLMSQPCRMCMELAHSSDAHNYVPTLSSLLVMPTYHKTIQNVHLMDVWQNAAMELQEADEVYFIGYGLPEADYLIRNLLVSNIRPDSKLNLQYFSRKSRKNYQQLFGNQIKEDDMKESNGKDYLNDLCNRIEELRIG